MGGDWDKDTVHAFFTLLAQLKTLHPEAIFESASVEGLPEPDSFFRVLERYSEKYGN